VKRFLINRVVDLLAMGGFEALRRVSLQPGHERIQPLATHAPWSTDVDFQRVYEQVRKHTLVDRYRCYELWELLPQICGLGGEMLEVGVWRGGTGGLICSRATGLGFAGTVFLADTFRGVVKAGAEDSSYVGGEHRDTSPALVTALLRDKLHVENFRLLEGIFPEDTGGEVESRQFCLCHIDVDVYKGAKDIFEWMWPRLKRGGVIVYDDYGFCDGVTKHVNEERGPADRRVIYNLNGHALIFKV
jgi:O-methyltransferase